MKVVEIVDVMIVVLQFGQYCMLCCNFVNGDMVGYIGNFWVVMLVIEVVDLLLECVLQVVDVVGGVVLIMVDYGNVDEMYEFDKKIKQLVKYMDGSFKVKMVYMLNLVFLIFYDNVSDGKLGLKQMVMVGFFNFVVMVVNLFGLEKYLVWDESVLEIK